jgi:P-type Mg2+ transporter
MPNISDLAHLPVPALLKQFNVTNSGLTQVSAHERLAHYGHNTFTTAKKNVPILEYLKHFNDPLIIVLLFIAIISYIMGEHANSIIISSMILLSVTLNFIQEHRASKAAEKLQEKVALLVSVLRDGKELEIPATKLVPGDILVLNAGDLIPADARVLLARDLFINQSSLTGESFPAEKNPAVPDTHHNNLAGLTNMLFAGTSVTTGSGQALVVKTGMQTEFSHIITSLAKADSGNDFTFGVHRFSRMLVKWIMAFVVIIFAVSALFNHGLFTSFSFAIAVAVSLTPEFLPMIMSVTMGQGALILAKKGIIVKKLVAIPAFGSMDILCTDKTGTLTQDKIKLVTYTDLHGHSSDKVLTYAYINSSFESGINNPMDEAVKAYKHLNIKEYKKIDEIPFDFNRRRLSIVVKKNTHQLMITKGSPETILEACTSIEVGEKRIKLNAPYKSRITNEYHRLSQQGFRVLAVSIKELPPTERRFTIKDEHDSTFIGFISFLDPVKSHIKAAIDSLEAIGIEIKVISGDNELVCQKTCIDADITIKGVLLGSMVDRLSDHVLMKKLEHITICARFSPSQKERIISLLRQKGHVVGYLGDGINDAPSLKAADIGISVSNAVDVAKESADLIMTHKSLEDLKEGVIAGRKIFGNTMKYIQMGLSSNFGNMFSLLGAVIFLPFLPMLPLQILLNNFLYDLAQMTIPTDHTDPEYVKTPKRWDLNFIKRFTLTLSPISTIFDFITFYILYQLFKDLPSAFHTGWFMESLATQIFVIYVIRTRKIPFLQSSPSPTLLISTITIVALGWLLPYTAIAPLLGFSPLPLEVVLTLSLVVIAYLMTTQLLKKFTYTVKATTP